MDGITWLYGGFLMISLGIAWVDFLVYRIPNRLIGLLFLLFVGRLFLTPYAQWPEYFWSGFSMSLLGLALAWSQGMGMGDIKFLIAASCWVSFSHWFLFLMVVSCSGALLAIFYMVCSSHIDILRARVLCSSSQGYLWVPYRNLPFIATSHPEKRSIQIPYGVAILVGCFWMGLKVIQERGAL